MNTHLFVYFILYTKLSLFCGLSEGRFMELNQAGYGSIDISNQKVWIEDVSFDGCVDECEIRASCTAVNYHRMFHLCELDKELSPKVASTKRSGLLYWIKTNQQDHVECGTNSCKPGDVCNIQNNACEIKECFPLSISKSNVIFGNVNAIGSNIKVGCQEGFAPHGSTAITLTCELDGTWKPEPITCMPVTLKMGISGHYSLTFAEAAGRCTDYGLKIATPVQLLEAWIHGMEMCSCGWLSDGSSGLILQSESSLCTSYPYNDGIMTAPCAFRIKQNVWCSF